MAKNNESKEKFAGEAEPEVKAETGAETKAEASAETKAEASAETKAEAKPETKAEAKPETKAEAKPETKAETGTVTGMVTGMVTEEAPKAVAKHEKTHEPFIHITKRDTIGLGKAISIRAVAILAAMLVCGVVTVLLTGDDPISVYVTMFKGAFATSGKTLVTFHRVALLLCIALAVTPAFKMRFWNTGAEGQVLIGALATAACMFWLGGKVPGPALIVIEAVAAVVAGTLWGVIPAIFKAYYGTNETLFTLMMNYVAMQFIEMFILSADKSGSNTVGPALLKESYGGWFPLLFGQSYILNILIVAVLTVVLYVYLNYSKQGYEIAVVGESENTARYIGISVKKVLIRTMAISGAICGICGLMLVAGYSHSITSALAGGNGFTAIMVSWLAKFDPFLMILTSFLIVFLQRGAEEVSMTFRLDFAFSDILTGIILFFIIGCEFFARYKVHFDITRLKKGHVSRGKEAE